MRRIFISFVFLLGTVTSLFAQQSFKDTVSVFTYNINNYGYASTSGCPTEGSPLKNGYLATILKYKKAPDVVSFQKFSGSPKTLASDSMQRSIMDSVCKGCYANTQYTNVSGYKKVNTLYYKTAKFGYVGTTTIYSGDNSISDINLHKLYYKSPSLATTKDTVFLNVIVVHDASGSSGASQRATEIGGAMSWLSSHVTSAGNYIMLGDFNTQNSSEACFQAMIKPADTLIQFNDPPNQLGDWAGSPQSFAKYLTQSTRRVDPGDCASTNTMLARFDHILCANPIMRGTKNVRYLPNTFEVVGQDGLHTGIGINDAPTNTSVPANVLNSLYQMSEHLPVYLQLEINIPAPLPIGFTYFKVSLQNNKPYLQWLKDNKGTVTAYEIERSTDGIVFTTIQTIDGNKGVTNYLDADFSGKSLVYYRIKEVLQSGGFFYSHIETIRPIKAITQLSVYPNPANSSMAISIQSTATDVATVTIHNTLGQTCLRQQVQLQEGNNAVPTQQVAKLAKGVYTLKVQVRDLVETKIFVKD